MTDKKVQSVVPRNVYDFIERLREEDPALLSSIAGIGKMAEGREEKAAARWIKLNPIAYGVGYWGGFVLADENNLAKNNLDEKPAENNLAKNNLDEKSAPEEIVDDIIENSKKVQEHAENIKEELKEKPARKRRRIPPPEVKNE